MARTSSRLLPSGSSRLQSSKCLPGKIGQASPQPIVTTASAAADELVGQRLPELAGKVDANLCHGLDDSKRVDHLGRVGAGGADVDARVGELVKQPCRHLRAPGVVDADEQDLRNLLGDPVFGLGKRINSPSTESMNEYGEEGRRPVRRPAHRSIQLDVALNGFGVQRRR